MKIKKTKSTKRITNGCQARFKDDNEIYTVSQWNGRRGWAEDKSGGGWYFYEGQVEVV